MSACDQHHQAPTYRSNERQRQADHVEIAAGDLPDERTRPALDAVGPGLVEGLAGVDVGGDPRLVDEAVESRDRLLVAAGNLLAVPTVAT